MKAGPAFVVMLMLAAAGAIAVLRLAPAPRSAAPDPGREPADTLVLAGHPATYALAHALAARTSIHVAPGWPDGMPWSEQAEFARDPSTEWQALAVRASAVVTLRNAARGDALFAAVRARNPRVIEIDASVASDQQTPSVRLRADRGTGPAFALSLTNVIRLAERIASDFTALHPGDAATITENLRATKERLLRLKARFDQEFARIAAPEVAVFGNDFDYLCEEFGLQVLLQVDKDPAVANEDERAALASQLRRSGVRVSLHAYLPGEALNAVLEQANVQPLVLDTLTQATSDPETFFQVLQENLARLIAALEA